MTRQDRHCAVTLCQAPCGFFPQSCPSKRLFETVLKHATLSASIFPKNCGEKNLQNTIPAILPCVRLPLRSAKCSLRDVQISRFPPPAMLNDARGHASCHNSLRLPREPTRWARFPMPAPRIHLLCTSNGPLLHVCHAKPRTDTPSHRDTFAANPNGTALANIGGPLANTGEKKRNTLAANAVHLPEPHLKARTLCYAFRGEKNRDKNGTTPRHSHPHKI